MFGVRDLVLGAALTFGVVLWWASRGTESAAEGFARLPEAPASHAIASTADTRAAPADKDDPAGAPLRAEASDDDPLTASEAGFSRYVTSKYHFLLEALGPSARVNHIRAALIQRERLVVAINTAKQGNDSQARAGLAQQQEELADADRRIAQMLPAAELTAFQVLKDSHIEQFQFDDFAQGIAQVAPLRDADRKALLFSKLVTRHRFREILDQSGLLRGDLAPAQRQSALADVSRALRESRDSFLQEARQHLADDEQYTLLASYENTEFGEEIAKLQRIAGGAGS